MNRLVSGAFASLAVALLIGIGGAGCGGEHPPPATGDHASAAGVDVARVHHTKCGACHQRIEPGERSRPELERALARHHTRVHLADEDWQRMLDYLARK